MNEQPPFLNASAAVASNESSFESRLRALRLFDIAEAAVQEEADEREEEAGLNLFLEDTIIMLRHELESMPLACARKAEIEKREIGRGRVFVMCGPLSEALRDAKHYQALAKVADVWLFGVPDAAFAPSPGLHIVPIPPDSDLSRERSAVVDGPGFGAVLFAREAGRLEEGIESSRYFEGYLSARSTPVAQASTRLNEVLNLDPLPPQERDFDLTLSWHSSVNTRFLEQLEGQKLALRARTTELAHLRDENRRREQVMRSYMGGRTYEEVQEAVDEGRGEVRDYRQELTICFCDLVGFTPMSERLHPFEVASFLNDHFARLHDIVSAHGGWIDKFIGDAMLAIFESPVEGLVASQKMVRESRSVMLSGQMEMPARIRVGLNTGVVAVANLGVPEKRERTVLGDAVNLAQRLQSIAIPHTIVVSSETYNRLPLPLTRHLEPFETQVKGKRDEILAYRWSVHSDRRPANERVVLRESLLNAARRAPLSERLGGLNDRLRQAGQPKPPSDE